MTVDRQAPPDEARQRVDATTEATVATPNGSGPDRRRAPGASFNRRRLFGAVVAAVVVAGVAMRAWAASPLWLDEAQSVAISRLPLDQMFQALREDGSPPLYYLLLHGWMLAFGRSDLAVRALSGLVSVATLPLMWGLVRRLSGSRSTAWAAVLLLAASPFAIRYATETRMYALVMLLTVLGGYALLALRRPGPVPVLGVAVVAGALALTHYWTLFLLAVVGAAMLALVLARRGAPRDELRRAATRGLLGITLGAVPFLPWLPSFAYQLAHTGAPWASAARFVSVGGAVDSWAGGSLPGQLLGFLYWALAIVGVAGRWDRGRLVLARPRGRVPVTLAVLAFAPLLVGVVVSHVLGSAYADRYSSISLMSFLILVAYGVVVLPGRARPAVLSVAAVLGLSAGVTAVGWDRTQAGQVAEVIDARGQQGDLVVVCPDQLGPAVHRLLPGGRFRQYAYPTFGDPARVDWTDYEKRNRAADPAAFADRVASVAGGHAVWYAYADGYRTLKYDCSALASELQARLGEPRTFVHERASTLEHETLVRYPARP